MGTVSSNAIQTAANPPTATITTPRLFRHNTRDGLTELLLERFGEEGEIDEAAIVAIIKEHTPKPFLGRGMKAIKPLLSDPSLAES